MKKPGDFGMSGMQKILEDLAEKKRIFEEYLKQLPKDLQEVPTEELKSMIEVMRFVRDFLTKYEAEAGAMSPDQKLRSSREKFNELCRNLDKMSIWAAKFSTENAGGASDAIPMEPFNQEIDSLYYVTCSGMSLRLKTAELAEGLSSVVQPVAERILFDIREGERSMVTSVTLKSRVVEYFSDSLNQTLDNGTATTYQPKFFAYKDGKETITVANFDEKQNKFVYPSFHRGDRVNSVFF